MNSLQKATELLKLSTSSSSSSINEPPLVSHPATLSSPTGSSPLSSFPATNAGDGFRPPFLIGVAGGGASGKKQVCKMVMEMLNEREAKKGWCEYVSIYVSVLYDTKQRISMKLVVIIKLEDFYRPLSAHERTLLLKNEYNFDHPDALDFPLLESCLIALLSGEPFTLPSWDFTAHVRHPSAGTTIFKPDVAIFEGNLMLYKKRIRECFNLKVFVDVDGDVRLMKQIIRDTEVRYKKALEEVLEQYLKYVKPSFEDFILPSKKFADVIIPRGDQNKVAISILAKHIADILADQDGYYDEDDSHSLSNSVSSLKRTEVAA
ncbi:UMP-CMP kinase [Chytridiales sp. JEL 0842]|nr:UMP-CMP kinase [Chytridiales sp. JEL 0842]